MQAKHRKTAKGKKGKAPASGGESHFLDARACVAAFMGGFLVHLLPVLSLPTFSGNLCAACLYVPHVAMHVEPPAPPRPTYGKAMTGHNQNPHKKPKWGLVHCYIWMPVHAWGYPRAAYRLCGSHPYMSAFCKPTSTAGDKPKKEHAVSSSGWVPIYDGKWWSTRRAVLIHCCVCAATTRR